MFLPYSYDINGPDRSVTPELRRITAPCLTVVAIHVDGLDGSPFPIRAKLPAGYRNAHVVLRARGCHRPRIA